MAKQSKSAAARRRERLKREEERRRQIRRLGAVALIVLVVAVVGFFVFQALNPESEDEAAASDTFSFDADDNEQTESAPAGQATTEEEDVTTSDEPQGELMETERALAEMAPVERNRYYDSYPEMVIDPENEYEAVIKTGKGEMRVELFAEQAPLTVNNFVFLANQGFYDGVTFHRVLEDFMAQGGDPSGTGTGGPGYAFEDETDNGLTFDRPGLLAMANAGPGTNGSQFFITFVPTPWLNGNHTIFGEVVAGEEVLSQLTRRDPGAATPGDTIEQILIYESEK